MTETMEPIQTEMFTDQTTQVEMFTDQTAPNPKQKSGEQLKEEGIQKALDNANDEWKSSARQCVRILCESLGVGGQFSSDDVNKLLDEMEVTTHNTSAMGGIFKTMRSHGWIEHCAYTKSTRPASHARVIGVWKIIKSV